MTGNGEEIPGHDAARQVVRRIFEELEAAHAAYLRAYDEVASGGALDAGTRPEVVRAIAGAATTLRELAPSLAETRTLPSDERPDAALIFLRLLTDSLSITLAERPRVELLVPAGEVDSMIAELRVTIRGSGADA